MRPDNGDDDNLVAHGYEHELTRTIGGYTSLALCFSGYPNGINSGEAGPPRQTIQTPPAVHGEDGNA